MTKEFDFRNHQVGDKVYHITRGWVKIEHKEENRFSIKVEAYSFNGKIRQSDENPTIYPYNPFEGNGERVIEVYSGFNRNWVKKDLIKELDNSKALCWNRDKLAATVWDKWREIEPKKELTTEQMVLILWKKFQENGR